MRKAVGLMGLFLFLSVPLCAGDLPEFELFGGYSYLRSDFGSTDRGYNGWGVSLTQNVNKWFGGVLDASGHYAAVNGIGSNVHTLMYGPVFSHRMKGNFTPFAHGLMGAVRGSQTYLGLSQPKFAFGAAVGGGFDVRIRKVAAIRVVQVDYLFTPFLGVRQDNVRLSTGLVFYFGQK